MDAYYFAALAIVTFMFCSSSYRVYII